MVSINGNLWSELGARAEAGELYLEPGVAQKCAQRCAELGAELDRIRRGAASLTRIDGLGHLPSGVALASKFEQKASGGEYPLDRALADHIAVVEQMQSVFEKIAATFAATEEANEQRVAPIEHGG